MADKAGQVNEFFNIEKFEKEKKIILDGLAQIALAVANTSTSAKSGGVSGSAASQKSINADMEKAAKLTQQLNSLETEQAKKEALLKEQIRQKNAEIKEEIGLDAKMVGAYQSASNELKKRIKDYKDLAMAGGAVTESAKAELKAIQQLDAQIKTLDKSLGQHQRNVGNYQSALDNVKGKIAMVTAGWAAGTAALSGLVAFMGKAISGAMEDERAERKLTLALDGNSKAAERLLRFKEQLMKTTLLGEDEIMSMVNYGLAMGRSEAETTKLVNAAISLSNATGGQLDVMGAMDQLNKTYSGDLGRLKRYTGDLTVEQLKSGDAIDIVNEKYKKFKSEGVATMEGEVLQMKKWWGETMDSIGVMAMNVVNGIRTGIMAITSVMGGGVSSKGLATQKAENTKAQQLSAHQQKMDAINAEIDNTKRLLGINLSVQDTKEKQNKIDVSAVEDLKAITEEYQRQVDLVDRMLGEGRYTGVTKMASKNMPNPAKGLSESRKIEQKPGTNVGVDTNPIPESKSLTEDYGVSAEAAAWNSKIQYAQDAVAKIDEIVNLSYANRFAKIDEATKRDEDARQRELDGAKGNDARIKQINEKYDAKEREREKEKRRLQKEKAKYDKTSAIIQGVINTALGVTGALAQTGTLGPFAWVMAALNLAAGIAEVALISSQPTPSYKKGRKGGPAEIANVGEAGRELIVTKTGEMVLTPPTTTTTYLPEGASVIPHDRLLEMAARAGTMMPYYERTATNDLTDLRHDIQTLHYGLARVIKNKKETHINITKAGMHTLVHDENTWHEWINSKVG